MICPSSRKNREVKVMCNKYGYDFRYFIRLMTLITPKQYCATLAVVILGFSPLSGNNSEILPPKRYDEHPRHSFREVPPGWRPIQKEEEIL